MVSANIIRRDLNRPAAIDKSLEIEPNKNASVIDAVKNCESVNISKETNFQVRHLNSIYLNNIYSVTTSGLIEDQMAIDKVKVDGINLYDVITPDCGGAEVCPNLKTRVTEKNTITIGFLSAYRWSQVSLRTR
ncbi:unnamed protein product [Leptosia nina]|uniref:Uncharacterized protein n=1 Tax=Leptosia nina TaxID=320188 RepID=A0AAV1JEL2_9NEOP